MTSHWITMAGVTLVTLAGFAWLFLLPSNLRGFENPYIGLLVFFAVPVVFFAGLALIPVGIALGRRRVAAGFRPLDRATAFRRAGLFFAVMTMSNLIIASQASYRAVEHMESNQFCGQTCHVMTPEFMAHGAPPHQRVSCATCHVAPGAQGWLKAKMAGTRQLLAVTFDTFPRPIESGLESGRLVSSADTCEQCHARERVIGSRLRVFTAFKDDESNTRTETILMMNVGGGTSRGIHGAHLGPGVHIRYAAADRKRQTIPWVEYRNSTSGESREYFAGGSTPDSVRALASFEMQCVDCHNRAAHSFESPDRAVDEAIKAGRISARLPFIKKTGVELLKAAYGSQDEAAQKIPGAVNAFYQQKYGEVWAARPDEIHAAGEALVSIYRRNVFPDLKVGWGSYVNNLGHMDDPGCFRCHDDSHVAADKKAISQDCNACHQTLASDEPNPAILKTIGLAAAEGGEKR